MDGPSCVRVPNDDCLINKLVKLTKSVETYQSRGWVKQKDARAQSSYQQHNDVQDLQAVLKGPVQPLNEAAKEPAAAMVNCAWHLGQCLPREEENEEFSVVGQMACFHHCTVTFKRWFFKWILAIPVRRGTRKMMAALQNISADENSDWVEIFLLLKDISKSPQYFNP